MYTGLGFVSDNLAINNMISSWIGVTFVFIFATRKVFENNSRIPLKWKYFIYIAYQVVLIFAISKILTQINVVIVNIVEIEPIVHFSAIISKVLITPITMILNFFVMKNVIEKL